MDRLKYLLDTNAIADYVNAAEPTTSHIQQALIDGHFLYLCPPVHYEVMRGLLHLNSTRKLRRFQEEFVSQLDWVDLTSDDWQQAARYWVITRNAGKQLSDVDLLIAAIATRLGAVIVTSDGDFDALPVPRENWRTS